MAVRSTKKRRASLVPPAALAALIIGLAQLPAAGGVQPCDCRCCSTAWRPPSMQVNGADTMCILNSTGDFGGTCEEQCQVGNMNTVFASTDNGVLESSRFCLLDCLPVTRQIGGLCRELSERIVKKLMTSDGNGDDPATLLKPTRNRRLPDELTLEHERAVKIKEVEQPAQEDDIEAAALAAMNSAGNLRGSGTPEFDAVAKLAEAAGKRAFAAAMDARSGRVETGSGISVVKTTSDFRQAKLNGKMANNAKARLDAAAIRAKIYAQSAVASEKRSLQEIQDMKAAPEKIAQEVATYAITRLKREAAWYVYEARKEEDMLRQHKPPGFTNEGAKAAAPWYAAEQRAISARATFQSQAQQLSDRASELQQQARTTAGQAVQYREAGNGKAAEKLMEQAQAMLDQAAQDSTQARKDFDQAQTLNHGLESYEVNAEYAGQRASAMAHARWMPPAVPNLAAAAPGPAPALSPAAAA